MRFVSSALLLAAAAVSQAAYHFNVEVTGRGKPVILIPGLTCSGHVWDATVARLKRHYQCHVLTLPGFAGQPPMAGPFLESVRDEIVAYVKAKKLNHPAIVGHSLGGFMGFYLESTEPDLFGPLVAVDGVPWLMALFNPKGTVDSVRPQVEAIKKALTAANASPEGFRNSLRATLNTQVKDAKAADRVLEDSVKTDPDTMVKAMAEMMLADIRPACAKIKAPVLLFASGDSAKSPEQKEMLRKAYEAQVSNVPNARVVPVWGARHFIMLDQPEEFLSAAERFLEESWSKR